MLRAVIGKIPDSNIFQISFSCLIDGKPVGFAFDSPISSLAPWVSVTGLCGQPLGVDGVSISPGEHEFTFKATSLNAAIDVYLDMMSYKPLPGASLDGDVLSISATMEPDDIIDPNLVFSSGWWDSSHTTIPSPGLLTNISGSSVTFTFNGKTCHLGLVFW
jgi:hypothetical protein